MRTRFLANRDRDEVFLAPKLPRTRRNVRYPFRFNLEAQTRLSPKLNIRVRPKKRPTAHFNDWGRKYGNAEMRKCAAKRVHFWVPQCPQCGRVSLGKRKLGFALADTIRYAERGFRGRPVVPCSARDCTTHRTDVPADLHRRVAYCGPWHAPRRRRRRPSLFHGDASDRGRCMADRTCFRVLLPRLDPNRGSGLVVWTFLPVLPLCFS